jgi:hypothetical protein
MQTFVIRVWVPGSEAEDASDEQGQGLRGLVEHVGTGKCAAFRGAEQLLSLVHASLESAARRNSDSPGLPLLFPVSVVIEDVSSAIEDVSSRERSELEAEGTGGDPARREATQR